MSHQACWPCSTRSDLERLLCDETAVAEALPLSLLSEITNGFADEQEIGRGGFAVVYKGVLENGAVAVKKLSKTHMFENQFHREVECLIKAKHKNVVRFIGYCADTQGKAETYDGNFVMADVRQRLLCFEYVPKGCLSHYINDESCGLEWTKRYQIINEICQGVHYLHEKNIIHSDLKPDNILLNDEMVPKIADFGLARCFPVDQSRVVATFIGGTLGYLPPEYNSCEITRGFDIYSLGVIITEMLTGKKGYHDVNDVLDSWRNRLEISKVDTMLEQIRVCVEIGIKCTQYNPADRPSIQYIINKLQEMDCSSDTGMSSSSVEQIIPMKGYAKIVCVDVHPAEPWIIITHFEGHFRIWNYQTQEIVMPFAQEGMSFLTAKFIVREQWIVAGGSHGYIYVFDYNTMEQIECFKALGEQITSLAIHPTMPYVLLASYDFEIGLWDWTNGWKSVQNFEEHSGSVTQIAFDPMNDNSFASVSKDETIKIWNVGSPHPSMTLAGHSSKVRCLDFFAHDDKKYLITGSDNGTTKIWDVQKTDCVKTLYGHENNRVSTVCSHPELPVLMTGAWDGTVRLYNSNTLGFERVLKKVGLGKVHALGCIKGSRRVVIGHSDGLAIMEI